MAKELEPMGEHGYQVREEYFEVSTGSTIPPEVTRAAERRHLKVVGESREKIITRNRTGGGHTSIRTAERPTQRSQPDRRAA